MKTKKSIILSAMLTIVMCASLIAGATFALFTTNNQVNIAVTSGKVDVTAEVDQSSLQYKQLGTDYSASGTMYAGNATINGGTVSLSKFVPGDGVKFNILIKNASDIRVNYRTVWMSEEDTGLLEGLTVSVNEAAYDGNTLYSNWQTAEVGSTDVVVPVTVEMPEGADDYMGKKCVLVFKVEAKQGNAAVDNNVARIGENTYTSLDEALAALQEGDTLEIIRPGTYAPFTITKKNVTVKGIVGDKKSESTVIKTTASKNVQAYADGVIIDSLYIDTTTLQTGIQWFKRGAVDVDIDNNTGTTAKNVTIQNCTLEGNGSEGTYALMWNTLNCTVKNNVFNGYDIGYYTMMDNYSAAGIVIEGNEFNGVKQPVNGYWGGAGAEDGFGLIINNNKFDDDAILVIWDFRQSSQWKAGNTTTDKPGLRAQIKGNSGKFVVSLTHCDMLVDNGNEIVLTNGASISYRSVVLFNGIDTADNYVVTNPDGSALVSVTGDSTKLTVANDKTYVYALSEGSYALKNTVTGEKFAFTVKHTAVGEMPSYSVIKAPESAADSASAITEAINNAASDEVTLTLTEGTYTLPAITNKTVSITGTKDTVIDMANKATGNGGLTLNMDGVTVKFGTEDYKGFQHATKLVYTNCTIYGKQFLYAADVEFVNCEFVQENADYNVWTYGAKNVLFKDCTFNCKGKSVLIYNEGALTAQTVEFQNCKFNASASIAGKAAIEIDSSFTSYNVIIDQATADNVTGFATDTISGSTVWNVKKEGKTTVVTVAGKTVYSK